MHGPTLIFYRPITMQRYNYPLSQPMTARKLLDRYGLLDLTEHQNRVFNKVAQLGT